MDPEDMTDAQMMRLTSLAVAALAGISTTAKGLISAAKVLERYIETGEVPE